MPGSPETRNSRVRPRRRLSRAFLSSESSRSRPMKEFWSSAFVAMARAFQVRPHRDQPIARPLDTLPRCLPVSSGKYRGGRLWSLNRAASLRRTRVAGYFQWTRKRQPQRGTEGRSDWKTIHPGDITAFEQKDLRVNRGGVNRRLSTTVWASTALSTVDRQTPYRGRGAEKRSPGRFANLSRTTQIAFPRSRLKIPCYLEKIPCSVE